MKLLKIAFHTLAYAQILRSRMPSSTFLSFFFALVFVLFVKPFRMRQSSDSFFCLLWNFKDPPFTPLPHRSIKALSFPHLPLFPPGLALRASASLQLISTLQAVVTTHHIMT